MHRVRVNERAQADNPAACPALLPFAPAGIRPSACAPFAILDSPASAAGLLLSPEGVGDPWR